MVLGHTTKPCRQKTARASPGARAPKTQPTFGAFVKTLLTRCNNACFAK